LLLIVAAVVLLMIGLAATVLLRSVESAVETWLPFAQDISTLLSISRAIPAAVLFFNIYILFYVLTPSRYRGPGCRKWPGALLITLWWLATVELMPAAISLAGGYDLTYGSLAGVMIVLLFFFVIGLGVVMGAELNAALAEAKPTALKGEVYSGPYKDQLEVHDPQPGEDVSPQLETGGTTL
jgi:membrane protein